MLLLLAACASSPTTTTDAAREPLTESDRSGPDADTPADDAHAEQATHELPPPPKGVETFTPRVVIYPDRIVLDDLTIPLEDGRVRDDDEGQGPGSLIIAPLQAELSELVTNSPMIETLIITAHESTQYRVINSVLYTADDAGFERYKFQTFGPNADDQTDRLREPNLLKPAK